jgi:hypothetical protein
MTCESEIIIYLGKLLGIRRLDVPYCVTEWKLVGTTASVAFIFPSADAGRAVVHLIVRVTRLLPSKSYIVSMYITPHVPPYPQ